MNKNVVLLGSNGYVGQNFKILFENKKEKLISISRKECDLLNKDKLFNLLKDTKPKYIINAAGYTGKPNVDACENDKDKCWRENVTLPKYLSEICEVLNLKYIQVSSGCIYSGKKSKYGFKETDEPNFCFDSTPCSYYSGTKAVMEDILKKDPNAYICRLRIPFNSLASPKNYITKLLNYNKLLNAENSLTNINDFVEACYYLINNNCNTGIYNITNTGSITTKKVVEYINKYITDKKFIFFKNENEFYSLAAITPRSNCVLDNRKLRDTGFNISDIQTSIRQAIRDYKK